MKNNTSKMRCKQGFTLIELLVVVLIIGILAAVALPQYQKAVEKTRLSEGLLYISALQKGLDVYFLANPDGELGLTANDTESVKVAIDIELPSLEYFDESVEHPFDVNSGVFMLERKNSPYVYQLILERLPDGWRHECDYYNATSEFICQHLHDTQGWTISKEF